MAHVLTSVLVLAVQRRSSVPRGRLQLVSMDSAHRRHQLVHGHLQLVHRHLQLVHRRHQLDHRRHQPVPRRRLVTTHPRICRHLPPCLHNVPASMVSPTKARSPHRNKSFRLGTEQGFQPSFGSDRSPLVMMNAKVFQRNRRVQLRGKDVIPLLRLFTPHMTLTL